LSSVEEFVQFLTKEERWESIGFNSARVSKATGI
jgi:hypothetical protein